MMCFPVSGPLRPHSAPKLVASLGQMASCSQEIKWDLGPHPRLHAPTPGGIRVPGIHALLRVLRAPPQGVDRERAAEGMSQLLAAHTCGSKEPSQEQPPRFASFPGLHRGQVLPSPRTQDKEGMARQAVIGGLGEYNGGPSGRPHPTS